MWILPMLPWTSIGLASAIDVTRQSSPPNFPLRLTDDRGRDIRLNHFATRIISLSPNITELVFAAGAGGKLVGVSRYSDYPAAAKSIPDVGDSSSLDLERIIALKPDLVVAWHSGNSIADIEKLEKLGLTVFATEATRLEDVPRLLRIIGTLGGTSTQAESAASAYETELRQIKRTYVSRRPVKVFQLIWHQPLMTVNGHHIINDIIDMCGGINVFASAASLTPVISTESLLEADPQAIIASVSLEIAETGIRERLSTISAIKNNHLFFVHPDLMHRQTPRILQAAKKVCAQLEEVRSG
ncbi:ABC transporter substrate-binding protein [Nitrosospira sp. NpAV]|nr:ABC transporter substrate-binding protein [Nitrosospira sp. NpAV]